MDICHSYLKAFVPLMRSNSNSSGPCAKLTFADAIQVLHLLDLHCILLSQSLCR